MVTFALSFLAMIALAAYSRKLSVRLFVVGLLVTVIFVDAKQSQAQDVSIPFLRQSCFLPQGKEYRDSGQINPHVRGPSVHLRIRNPSWDVDAWICIYDKLCQAIRYQGRLAPSSDYRIQVCANGRRRASIVILEAYGRALVYDNIRTGTIKLPYRRSRR